MRQEVEIEFKNLLTEEEYLKLKYAFFKDQVQPVTQNNYYFDTAQFTLKNNLCALRIRLKEQHAELTLKTPFEGHHTETTIDLDIKTAQKIVDVQTFSLPDEMSAVLSKENIAVTSSVSLIGHLKTERLERVDSHSIIVLDKSYYSGQVDFELEIESDSISVGENLFNKILVDYNIPVRSTPNKIARAFNSAKE